ncbi:hypothetical protein [Glutamicibacter creatinolyticus]|uniref:hypothetical protein n=1 Tax=Glutamicibacter creatinolyticus TaxID=162496 RepID=UPI00321642C7
MAIDPKPWMVGGGASHSVEVARLLPYATSSGAEGIVEPISLQVQAMQTPGKNVRVAPGAAFIRNRYKGALQQSYVFRNASQTEVTITATGSAGARTDLLVARVLDPQFEGPEPEDPDAFDYSRFEVIEGVPTNTKSAKDLNLSYPAIALARITIPKSTATITNSMVTDLREVALPRRDDVWRPRALVTEDMEVLTGTGPVGEWFPNSGGVQEIYIPEWATRAQIRCQWLSVRYGAGNAYGQMWVEFGPYKGPSERERSTQRYQFDTPAADNVMRANWNVVDDVYIPAALRGTTQHFVPKAAWLGGVRNSVSLDGVSGMSMEVRFLEVADPSTT